MKYTRPHHVWVTIYLDTETGVLFSDKYLGSAHASHILRHYPHILYIVSTDRRWSILELWLAARSKLHLHQEYKDLRRKV